MKVTIKANPKAEKMRELEAARGKSNETQKQILERVEAKLDELLSR